jgi:hypothetical protein
MMNEEVECRLPFSFCLLTSAVAGFLDNRDEDGGQFVALGTERLQLGRWHDLSIAEEFQSIRGFLQLPTRVAAFGDECPVFRRPS